MKGGQLPEEVRQAVASLSENRQQQRRSLLGRFEARLRDLARVQKDRVQLEAQAYAEGTYKTEHFQKANHDRLSQLAAEEDSFKKSLRDLYGAIVTGEANRLSQALPDLGQEVPLLARTLADAWCRTLARRRNVTWTPENQSVRLPRGATKAHKTASGILEQSEALLQMVLSNPSQFLYDWPERESQREGYREISQRNKGFESELRLGIKRLQEVLDFLEGVRNCHDMEAHDALLDGNLGFLDFDE